MVLLQILLTLFVMFFFLSLCFLFSGMETGMISIDQIALEHAAKKSKSRADLLKFIRQPDKFLGTTLIGNNVVNVILASLATYFVQKMNNLSFDARYTSLVIGAIVLVFGEILPKSLFRDHSETMVPVLFPVLRFFYIILKPFVAVVTWMNQSLRRLLHLENDNQYDYLTKDDLTFLLSQTISTEEDAPEMEMIEDALDFTELLAKNVMVPRMDIVAIEDNTPIPEIIELTREEGFTRYPVYHGSIDNITGILIIYDILKRNCTPEMTAGEIVHEPLFAPENTDLDVLLKEMQTKHRSMAVIVDSFGGTSGIITMEDILEEIVGDIEDEYDAEDEEKDVEQISPNTWLAAADVEIDRLVDDYGIELPEGDYETIAGLILDHLERIPHQGQVITIAPYRLQVLQATSKKIVKVKIHKLS